MVAQPLMTEQKSPPDSKRRSRLVARLGDLSDLSALVSGPQWRRCRRPRRHHRAARLCRRPRRRWRLAQPVLHLADARLRLRRVELPRRRSDLRHARRFRPAAREGAFAEAQGDHRPGDQPLLRQASMVPREPAQPDQRQDRLVRLGRPQARRHAAQQLALDLRRQRLDLGQPAHAVLHAQFPRLAARPQLPQSGSAGCDARQYALLAGARR